MKIQAKLRSLVLLIICALLMVTQASAAPAPPDSVRVIVQGTSVEDAAAAVRANGGRVTAEIGIINAVVAEVPQSSLDSLAETPGVIRVTLDRSVQTAGERVNVEFSKAIGAAEVWEAGNLGEGVTVAILDTGIDPTITSLRRPPDGKGNRILDNWANVDYDFWDTRGGGVAIGVQDQVTMTNNIIAGNHYADVNLWGDNGGGAIYIGGQTTPEETRLIMYHNTVADNQSPAILNESAAITMSHSIFYSQTMDIKTIKDTSGLGPVPLTSLDYTLWWPAMGLDARDGSVIAVNHDFTADPLFTTLGLDDYHLWFGSPAIDLGPGVGVTSDIDGHLRPIGNGYDLGADEALFVYLPLVMRSP